MLTGNEDEADLVLGPQEGLGALLDCLVDDDELLVALLLRLDEQGLLLVVLRERDLRHDVEEVAGKCNTDLRKSQRHPGQRDASPGARSTLGHVSCTPGPDPLCLVSCDPPLKAASSFARLRYHKTSGRCSEGCLDGCDATSATPTPEGGREGVCDSQLRTRR